LAESAGEFGLEVHTSASFDGEVGFHGIAADVLTIGLEIRLVHAAAADAAADLEGFGEGVERIRRLSRS
jgi:hypothetical protein